MINKRVVDIITLGKNVYRGIFFYVHNIPTLIVIKHMFYSSLLFYFSRRSLTWFAINNCYIRRLIFWLFIFIFHRFKIQNNADLVTKNCITDIMIKNHTTKMFVFVYKYNNTFRMKQILLNVTIFLNVVKKLLK